MGRMESVWRGRRRNCRRCRCCGTTAWAESRVLPHGSSHPAHRVADPTTARAPSDRRVSSPCEEQSNPRPSTPTSLPNNPDVSTPLDQAHLAPRRYPHKSSVPAVTRLAVEASVSRAGLPRMRFQRCAACTGSLDSRRDDTCLLPFDHKVGWLDEPAAGSQKTIPLSSSVQRARNSRTHGCTLRLRSDVPANGTTP